MFASSPAPSNDTTDDCSICLNALVSGTILLTLTCNHKFHLQCLASNVKAHNNECPLCRTVLDASLIQMLATHNNANITTNIQQPTAPAPIVNVSHTSRSSL